MNHDGKQVFRCDRLTPVLRVPVTFEIEAVSGAHASQMADDLAFACGWATGVYPNREVAKRSAPPQWLIEEAKAALKANGHVFIELSDELKAALT